MFPGTAVDFAVRFQSRFTIITSGCNKWYKAYMHDGHCNQIISYIVASNAGICES